MPWKTPWKPHVLPSVGVDVAPVAAVADLPPLDGHLVLAGAEPLDEQLGIGVGLEHEVSRRVELAGDVDEGQAWGLDLVVAMVRASFRWC